MGKNKNKNNAPKNAFYHFMLHVQKEKKGGRTISLQEASIIAGEKWQRMGANERAPFENLAKAYKQATRDEKYTSQGVPLSLIEAQKQAEKLEDDRRKLEIQNIIRHAVNNNALDVVDIVIININIFLDTNKIFIPAEIAISKFNLKEGVYDTFHSLINPGEIPTGYSFDAKSLTDESHRLPLPPDALGETDMEQLFSKAFEFIMEGRTEMPPLYTTEKEIHNTKGVLLQICDKFRFDDIKIRVYNIAEIFLELRNACAKFGIRGTPVYHNLGMAEMDIDKDVYDYCQHLACEYHETTDVINMCSLSRVKRWGYIIADYCCKDLDIKIIKGKHVPMQSNIPIYEESKPPAKRRFPSPPNSFVSLNSRAPSVASSRATSVSNHWVNHESRASVKYEENDSKMRLPSTSAVTSKMNSLGLYGKVNDNTDNLLTSADEDDDDMSCSVSVVSGSRRPKPGTTFVPAKYTAAALLEANDASFDDSWTTVQSKKVGGIGRGRGFPLKKN